MSDGRRWLFTCVFYASAMALALYTSDLGELFTIFGSLCGWATLFGVPGALLLDRAGPWSTVAKDRAAGVEVGVNGVSSLAFVAGWTMILGGGAVCGLCLALSLLEGAVREACDDQQTAAVALCVSQCGACPNGQGAVAASSNCTDGDICALEAAFVLAEGCLFHFVPAKDVLEHACMGV